MSRKEHKKKDYLKHRAEQLLKNKDTISPDLYSKNLEELIENLQVYQFELEIQNEELKRLQLDLESSHKRFQTLFEHAPIGYCTLNMEGTILQTNTAFRAMVDEPSSVLKKKKLRVFIHPDSQDDFYFHLKKVNGNSDNHTSHITFKGANDIVHTNFRTRVTSLDNEPEKVILCAINDITETRLNHQQLQERVKEQTCLYQISKTLQKTNLSLSTILQKCVEIIPGGFQHPEKALAKIQIGSEEYFSNEAFSPCEHFLQSQVDLDETSTLKIFVCYKQQTSNTHDHNFDFLVEEQKLMDAITENIAQAIEYIRARQEIDEKNEKLKKLNAEKDRLFSIIAHDLRSPFSSIMGLINIMEERFDNLSKDAMQQMIQAINKSTGSLFTLLENLLEWSRLQRGQTKTRPSLHKASEIVEEAINTNNSTFVGKDITIKQNIDPDITINVDKTSIISVFNNLLSNAVKFTERGGIITISAQKSQEEVKFSICDTGIGMNESMQKTLFDVDADVKREGTEHEPSSGLGLLISKEFVELNEGNIWVESKENEGSCFYFTLPCPKPK